jgi:hypothetical protein
MENSRGERGHPCFMPKSGWTAVGLSPSNSVYSSALYKFSRIDSMWTGIWFLQTLLEGETLETEGES